MKNFFKVIKFDGTPATTNGLRILKVINTVCWSKVNSSNEFGIPPGNLKIFNINTQKDWLTLAKIFYINAKNSAQENPNVFEYCEVQIGGNPNRVTITGAFNRMVGFPNNQDSYEQITNSIQLILTSSEISDKGLAKNLEKHIKNPSGNYRAELLEHRNFLDCLLVLLCSVEPSRHFPMAAYTTMLFDLIKYPNPKKKITWKNAFVSEKNYKWDDYEHQDYGGYYPGATKSTGSGNYRKAVQILIGNQVTNNKMEKVVLKHQHHMVLIRGMTFSVYWLSLFNYDYFKNSLNRDDLLDKIKELVTLSLNDLFNTGPAPNLNVINYHLYAPLLQQPPPPNPHIMDGNALCYYFEHTNNSNNHSFISSFFHRNNYACKLVPEYIRKEKTKTVITNNNESYETSSSFLMHTIQNRQASGQLPCPCCYKPSHQAKRSSPIIVAVKNNTPNIYHKTFKNTAGCYSNFFADSVSIFSLKEVKNNKAPCTNCWPNGLPEQPINSRTLTIS